MKHFAGLAFLRHWAISSLLFFYFSTPAQDISVGTWRTHFSYNDAQIVVQSSDKIFCAAANGLFSVDLDDSSIRKLSKMDGLSDVGISAMKYDQINNILVIGYRSGLIDLVFENEIKTITDIFNSNLEGDKQINDITFDASKIYLATDLGVIVVNSNRSEIVENYVQIGVGGSEVQVVEISYLNNVLFARTNEGIQSGTTSKNLLDFNNWTHYETTSTFTDLTQVDDQFYALNGLDLFQLSANSWGDTGADVPTGASSLFSVNNDLIAAANGSIFQLSNGLFEAIEMSSAMEINDIIWLNNQFFLADGLIGLVDQEGTRLSPQGPISDDFSRMRIIRNQVYGFHAPSPFSSTGSSKSGGYSLFTEGRWRVENISNFQNVSDVALFNNNYYFSSIGDGLYDQSNDQIISQISGSSAELDTIIVALRAGNKLWASSFNNSDPIHAMDQDEEWISYSDTDLFEDRYTSIELTLTGNAWLGGASGSITVIDEGQDQIDRISTSDGLPSTFTDIELSVEDDAWIGTTSGPVLFTNASFVGNSQAITPSFENRILFEDEIVNAVMTDGGNRIWFGTNRGLWIFNENTSEQIALFNESNSPIPSNSVLDLTYNPENGEVFINTDKGLVSFRSASSVGTSRHQNVTIFPNPVRPNYSGLVGIKGVAKNVSIKITDISGNLVKEIEANGGTASWDLLDASNAGVVSGVYLFFSSSSNGIETYVGKIAVIR